MGADLSNPLPKPPFFTPAERRLIARLDTPEAVQDWLGTMPYNWERNGETARTLRGVLRAKTAHCLEAALAAATILEAHGYPPLILDIESTDLLDHVLFIFQRDGRWGSIGRSRCVGLHGRKPLFANLDDLVRSYMAPFIDTTGRVKGYGTLDLRDLKGVPWRNSNRNVWSIAAALNNNQHTPTPTPERFYREWKGRFDSWWDANERPAHEWPIHYPDRDSWMGPGALAPPPL